MSRPKGSKNKPKDVQLEQFGFSTEERIKLVANLVVERIMEDQQFAAGLLPILENRDAAE